MERRWKVLIVVVAGVFMAGLDVFIVNIAFPQLHTDFPGTSLRSLSWVLNSYTIVFAAFLIAAGPLVGHVRAQALLPARHGPVRNRLGRLRAGAVDPVPRRRACDPGSRRGAVDAGLARAAAA